MTSIFYFLSALWNRTLWRSYSKDLYIDKNTRFWGCKFNDVKIMTTPNKRLFIDFVGNCTGKHSMNNFDPEITTDKKIEAICDKKYINAEMFAREIKKLVKTKRMSKRKLHAYMNIWWRNYIDQKGDVEEFAKNYFKGMNNENSQFWLK